MTQGQRFATAHDQVWARITVGPDHDVWTGYCMPDGSPQVRIAGHGVLVRRFTWEEVNGPIPNGMFMRRTCGEVRCVRPAHYRLSDTNVKDSIDPLVRFEAFMDRTGAYCWEWAGSIRDTGYGQFNAGNNRMVKAHRFAWELASGQTIPDGMDIGHTCDNRRCVRNEPKGTYVIDGVEIECFGHLFLCTTQQNVDDAIQKDRHTHGETHRATMRRVSAKGESHGSSRFTVQDVLDIRKAFANGETQGDLARKYGCTWGNIDQIVKRLTWKHVP